jgi:hypothetical protein
MKTNRSTLSALKSAALAQPITKNFLRAALALVLASTCAMPRGLEQKNTSSAGRPAPSHSAPAINRTPNTPSRATQPSHQPTSVRTSPTTTAKPSSGTKIGPGSTGSKQVNTPGPSKGSGMGTSASQGPTNSNKNVNVNTNTNTNTNTWGHANGSNGLGTRNGNGFGGSKPGLNSTYGGSKSGSAGPGNGTQTATNSNTNVNTNTNVNKNITINQFGGRNLQGSGRGPQGPMGRSHSARIPDDHFRSHFGRDHEFHVSHRSFGGDHPGFQFGGVSFGLVQPVPVAWAETDPLYVDYVGGSYFLCNRLHAGVRVPMDVEDCADCTPAPDCTDCATTAASTDDSSSVPTLTRGQTPDQVVAMLGAPKNVIDLGVRTIYVYSDMKVTFLAGRLSDVH